MEASIYILLKEYLRFMYSVSLNCAFMHLFICSPECESDSSLHCAFVTPLFGRVASPAFGTQSVHWPVPVAPRAPLVFPLCLCLCSCVPVESSTVESCLHCPLTTVSPSMSSRDPPSLVHHQLYLFPPIFERTIASWSSCSQMIPSAHLPASPVALENLWP